MFACQCDMSCAIISMLRVHESDTAYISDIDKFKPRNSLMNNGLYSLSPVHWCDFTIRYVHLRSHCFYFKRKSVEEMCQFIYVTDIRVNCKLASYLLPVDYLIGIYFIDFGNLNYCQKNNTSILLNRKYLNARFGSRQYMSILSLEVSPFAPGNSPYPVFYGQLRLKS